MSRRHLSKALSRCRARRLFLEALEQRQMLTSVPVALNDPLYSTAVNTDLTISTTAAGIVNNDFDADGNSLSASVVANPANGSLVSFNSNGTFTYRPNTSFTGIDSFTYKVTDGTNDSNVATVSVAVGGNFGPRTNLDEVPQNAMLMTGALALGQPLTLGHELVYRSDTVNPHTVVVLETSLLSSSSVPDSIDARLTFNGVQESTVSYTNSGVAAGDALRFVLKADTSTLATGYYDWSIELKAWFGGNSYTRTYTGSQAVVNRSSSEYGKGWWMVGLDQLYASSAGALLVRGNGDTLWFMSDGSGGYLKALGDTSFSTLVKNGNNTFTLTSKYGDKENFGTTGLLASRVDTNDNTVSYTYTNADGDGSTDELWKITDPFSRDSVLAYTSGQLTSFQDLASRTTTLAHTSGKLTSVTHPDPDAGGSLSSPVTEYQYDATTALLTIAEDPLNYQTTYAYSGTSRRLTSINHPNSTGWSLTAQQTIGLASGSGNTVPDPVNAIGTYTDERSKVWSFKTDRYGKVTYFKDPLNNVTTTERDANGLPIRLTETDPDGAGSATSPVTKFGYNSSGDLVNQYLSDGNDLQWTYNSLHRVLTQTNELNNTWEFTYDTDGNLTAAEDSLGNTTSYTVNSRGQVTAITTPDPDGAGSLPASSTSFAYNSSTGTLSTITNPGSSTRTFSYNSADLQLTMTDELSHVWSTAYDNLNRVTSQTSPDPDGAGSQTAAVTSFTYNANSWLTEVVDALGNDTDYTYNSRGWVTQIQRPDPDGAGSLTRPTSTYTYNNVGQVVEEGQAFMLSGSIQYAYNDAGWLTSKLGPVVNTTGDSYAYDNLGRVTKAATVQVGGEYRYDKYSYNSRGFVISTIESVVNTGTLVDGPTTTYTHDAAGQLTSTTDALGNTTAYTYDARGLVTKTVQADPDGTSGGLASPVTTYGYDNVGRNTSITDSLGRVTTLAYDNRDRLTTITQPDPDGAGGATSPVTTYAYNNASLRTSVTDPLSRVTSYGYDNANRLVTITSPDPDGAGSLTSPVTTYFYNKLDSVTSVADPLGNVTSITYDNLQRQTQVTQADPDAGGSLSSPLTSYTYNAQGLLSQITDPLSHNTTYGYDNFGRRTTVTNHESKTTTTAYDNFNRVTSVTTPDPDGAGSQTASQTTYTYDLRDRVTQITDPRSGNTAFTYDALGQLTNLRDTSNNDTSWTFDGLGRVTAETNELNKTRYFAYDAASNLVRQTDRNNRTTRYSYDNLDHLTDEKWYDGGTVPTATAATTTQGGPHDEVQRVGYSGSVFSGTFTLTFDGQTTGTISHGASAATVKSALEALSNIDSGDINVAKVQDTMSAQEWQVMFKGNKGGTNVAQITINVSGLFMAPTAVQATDTQGSATNAEVQAVAINNATGGTFRLTFGTEQTGDLAYNASAGAVETALDGLAGIDNVSVSGSGTAASPYTITFGGTQSNTNVAQITADVTFLTSGTLARTLSYAYDAASQLTSTTDPDSSYAYTYDNLGRVLTSNNSGTSGVPTVVLTSAYNANSQRTSLSATRGGTNDFLNSYTYDNLNRLTRVDQTGNGGATVANKRVDFEYNAVGQFTTITRQVKPSSTWNEVATSTFTYDTLNRLTALDHKHGVTDIANYDWTYDAMNRVTQLSGPDGTSDYTYDKESQVTATDHSFQTDESYTYDATGNRTNGSYAVGTNNRMTSDGTYDYTYDDEGNRLTRTKISDDSITEYTWDHRNRLTKVVERADGDGEAITKQTDYKYDIFDRRISKSYDADGAGGGSAVVSRYVYFRDNVALQFDGSNNLTHRYLYGPAVDQILADEDSSNNILWPLTDNLGTVRDLVDDSGAVQNHLKYDSFGKVTAESNAAVDHIFAFTGRERDEESGLQYHRARYYDPSTARWLSEDPKGFAAGDNNLSRYVANSSTNLTDPSGLDYDPASDPSVAGSPANIESMRQAVLSVPTSGQSSDWGWDGSGWTWQDIQSATLMMPISPLLAVSGVTPSDIGLMLQHPVASAGGAMLGTGHGLAFVANAVSYPVQWATGDTRLDQYCDALIEENGGTYQAAQYAADMAAIAGWSAFILDGLAVYGVTQIGYTPITLPWIAGGATTATTAATTNCFVAGTPVLMDCEADGDNHSSVDPESTSEPSMSWVITVGIAGFAALVVVRKSLKRRRQNQSASEARECSNNFALPIASTAPPAAPNSEGNNLPQAIVPRACTPATSPLTPVPRRQGRFVMPLIGACALAATLIAVLFSVSKWSETNVAEATLTTVSDQHELEADNRRLKPIEKIEVGERVALAENPAEEFDASFGHEIDPPAWCKISLRPGPDSQVVLLRPRSWFVEHLNSRDGTLTLPVPEVGIAGPAEVLAVGPCPAIEPGQGCIVTGTFAHVSLETILLSIEGLDEPIRCTPNHATWSADRHAFVEAQALKPGEAVQGARGISRVSEIVRVDEPVRVFNLEVFGQHVYQVSSLGILVHNPGGGGSGGDLGPHNFPFEYTCITLPEGSRLPSMPFNPVIFNPNVHVPYFPNGTGPIGAGPMIPSPAIPGGVPPL